MIKTGPNRILWLSLAFLSLIAALTGVLNPAIYSKLVDSQLMPGIISQDLTSIVASTVLLFLIIKTKKEDRIKQMVILGIISFLFYAYGIYVIERVYNVLYLVYMAIFGLSFYSIVYGVVGIRQKIPPKVEQSRIIRHIAVVFLLMNPLIFYPLWINQLLPLIQSARKIEFFYSVYILDLCLIMPAFIIIAIMVAKKESLGLLLTPSLFILGFTLLLPVGLGELIKPFYNLPVDTAGMFFFLSLSILFLLLAVWYLRNLRISK